MTDSRTRLARMIAQYSYRESAEPVYRLSSGGTSNILVDLSQTLRRPIGLRLLGSVLREPFSEVMHLAQVSEGVGGPALGADPVAAVLAMECGIYWFSVRANPKERGFDQGAITGPVSQGHRVLLVEDVVTTGTNLLRAAAACDRAGLTVTGVFAVVDRGGLAHVQSTLGLPAHALFTLEEIQAVVRETYD